VVGVEAIDLPNPLLLALVMLEVAVGKDVLLLV
jgi:hypothetical protein